ncbi:hypothetical protein J6590_027859 [Homalodisca vitripennis]|nr:hypothetical protein J6590_027859 [Homalodisca vitripennis]
MSRSCGRKGCPHLTDFSETSAIECPKCKKCYHVYCTDIGDSAILKMMAESYKAMWRCNDCVDVFSPQTKLLVQKLTQLQLSYMMSRV